MLLLARVGLLSFWVAFRGVLVPGYYSRFFAFKPLKLPRITLEAELVLGVGVAFEVVTVCCMLFCEL